MPSQISIHALLAESDRSSRVSAACHWYFYPRSPCGERRKPCRNYVKRMEFLSTLSLRRATVQVPKQGFGPVDFYPRSPCGERPHQCRRLSFFPHFYPRSPCGERQPVYYVCRHRSGISIHALLAESDLMWPWSPLNNDIFLSTLSLRRATQADKKLQNDIDISIHALLAESDLRS